MAYAEWNDFTTYIINDLVIYGEIVYKCINSSPSTPCLGKVPPSFASFWVATASTTFSPLPQIIVPPAPPDIYPPTNSNTAIVYGNGTFFNQSGPIRYFKMSFSSSGTAYVQDPLGGYYSWLDWTPFLGSYSGTNTTFGTTITQAYFYDAGDSIISINYTTGGLGGSGFLQMGMIHNSLGCVVGAGATSGF